MPGMPLLGELLLAVLALATLLGGAVLMLRPRARGSAPAPDRPVTGGELARRMLQQQRR